VQNPVCLAHDDAQIVGDGRKGAHQGAHLGHDQGGADAMSGGISNQHAQPIPGPFDEIVAVAARLVRRLVPAGDVIARHAGVGIRQEGLLDVSRDGQGVLNLLFLGVFVEQHLTLERHAGEGAERARQRFVHRAERSAPLVEHLEHAHDLAVDSGHGEREQVAGAKTGSLVHVRVEAGVGVGVGDVDDAAAARGLPGDSSRHRKADVFRAGRDFAVQLTP